MKKIGFLLALIALFGLACAPKEEPPAEEPAAAAEPEAEAEPVPIMAVAELRNAAGEAVGFAQFTQEGAVVSLEAEVGDSAAADGAHGFHVHEVGECVPPFTSAGGHFNPEGTEHGCPPSPDRHGGDFGNIEIVEGGGTLDVESQLVTVAEGPRSVVGRAVILHEGTDDCTSQPTGDAGSRLACGVIVSADEAEGTMADDGGDDGEADAEEDEYGG